MSRKNHVKEVSLKWMYRPSVTEMARAGVYEMVDGKVPKIGNSTDLAKMYRNNSRIRRYKKGTI